MTDKERITKLEERLAQAEARVAQLEARPYPQIVVQPQTYPIYPRPYYPSYPTITYTTGLNATASTAHLTS